MRKTIILIIIGLLMLSFGSCAQKVTKDSKGNLIAVKSIRSAKDTVLHSAGITYTDTKGVVYPVYLTANKKYFVMRESKAGNKYKQYLKL